MAVSFTRFAKQMFVFFHVAAALLFLLACYGPYLSPERWWFLSFLGLGFAILLAVLIFFIFFWIVFAPRYMLISLLAMALGWKAITSFITLRPLPDFVAQKAPDTLRVMHWNVARFLELRRNDNNKSRVRARMLDIIKRQDADVLCFQEFYHSTDPQYYDNLNYIQQELNYPHVYFTWMEDGGKQWFGQAIFSRFPIVDTAKLVFPKPGLPETLLRADIAFGGDTVRVMTTHLQSVQFKKEDYESLEEIKSREDSMLQNSRSIFSKLKRAAVIRGEQAALVRAEMERSPHPIIITGDLNDVPNSYTYYTIGKGMQDAFLRKGFGIGRTYSGISPTLRIDYILTSKSFEVVQFQRIVRQLSDHYALVTDLKWKK
ncbi:endonuclease/exonuclease/phosphatase family protein [Paracnuella aquatica]|uniref:endonuclease/exonuclease/phosphatase family protein n=1 Tax=Paracnuella aquatica TaxID=2268757 RepID=UPI000DEF7865|nr:endonuclease/exonuclease/phosphatase family protein [Paracnuella aquatica]RPD44259.1 endonuclease/exonuclease/phosphatase [Paracnuella aquatica]